MVSISRAAPAASKIWRVALMISGPMPSPCATVIGVFVGIIGTTSIVGLLNIAQQDPVVFFYTGQTISSRRKAGGVLTTYIRCDTVEMVGQQNRVRLGRREH